MKTTKFIKEAFNRGSDNDFVLVVANALAMVAYVFYIYVVVTGIYTEDAWTILKWAAAIITGEVIMIVTKWIIFTEVGTIMIMSKKY